MPIPRPTLLAVCLSLLAASEPSPGAEPMQTVRLPVTRDTWFSNVGSEGDGNNGGSPQLKLKSIQEMSLIDIDPAPLRGRVIREATLHVHRSAPPKLLRVTVGTFGAEWVEGSGYSYEHQKGSATHNHRRHPDVPWAFPGSDLCSVILGQGGTFWRMADASAPDADGWQRIPVDPSVLAARVAGVSHGLFLFDDTGSEWTRKDESFRFELYPNRFIHSHESRPMAPYLTVILGPEDHAPPAALEISRVEVADLPAGEALISWTTPRDQGPAGTIGFLAEVDGKDVPRYLIPAAGTAVEAVTMHLRDLNLAPGAQVKLSVKAVDGAGNVGPEAASLIKASARTPRPLPASGPQAATGAAPLPQVGNAQVAILDELDKVNPFTGALIPSQPEGYLGANHLWSAKTKQVRLFAAKNEFVSFQILLRGKVTTIAPSLRFANQGEPLQVSFGHYQNVSTKAGPLPDPIVPLKGTHQPAPGPSNHSLHAEVYVPHGAPAGDHRGTLALEVDGLPLKLDVVLRVWDFTLPDFLSFLPEMNCYDLPENERDYYRLAHRHRTVLNRVPYHHNGKVADGCAPKWDGTQLDWSAWDRRFGPLFDGSAFADLPRKAVPIEGFYLPIFENWPSPMEGHYNGDYWADRAFPESYWRDFREVARHFAEHANGRHWEDTLFQFYLNGKVDFKRGGWSRGTCPWLLDEPASFQDYWALRTFSAAFHEGINQAPGRAKLVFRADISRPQWQRDALDGLLDYNVVGSALRRYHRLVMDRKQSQGQLVNEYGSTNALEDSNMQPVAWCLDAWSLGTDGVLPWQTLGSVDSWTKADPLSLFYPARPGQDAGPVPSIRLKAYRRGQQDVEYLTLLSQVESEPRWALGQRVRESLHLAPEGKGTGFTGGEDAGVMHYGRLRPQDVWALRVQVGQALSDKHPIPKRKLVELRTPRREPSRLSPRYVSGADAAVSRSDSHR